MWMTVFIAGFLFAGMVGILVFGYQQVEQENEKRSAAALASAEPARSGHCMLCDAPLRRPSTTDQVVFEIEHRIDAELQDIVHLMRTAPDAAARLYQA
jgi:hypothetical protein